ncbi:oligosaccharide flippase family protein [Rhizobacter fulvus]|jgi:PST family polysaccharide transporter
MTLAASATARDSGRRDAARNMAWLLGDKSLALLIGLGVQGLIARHLGPVGSGHFAYAAALLQVGLGLSLVCAGVALLPRFCRMQAAFPGAIANIFALRFLASLIAMAAMMLFCGVMVGDPQRRQVSMILLLAVPLIEPFYVIATYWLSRNHNRPTVVARSCGLVLRAITVVVCVYLGAPVWAIAGAWVLESAVNASLQAYQARKAFPNRRFARFVRWSRMGRYFSFGIRFVSALWLSQLFLRLDRLVLANWMEPLEFGLYAAPMQLVEVWTQVAYLVGTSIGTAYLYRQMRERTAVNAFLTAVAAMTAIGLVGLLGAWLLGPTVLRVVYGAGFDMSAPYLLAGAGFATLLFADQAIDMLITGLDLPRLLAAKWLIAVVVAVAVFFAGFPRFGAFVGPIGMSCGVVAGWLGLLVPLARSVNGGRDAASTP